jgi:uncharacterized protein (TIGR01777 family)
MTFLITGATGFIGKKLTHLLLARGDAVNYLGRERSPQLDSRVAYHPWPNVNEPPPLNSVPRLDAIIHLAGEPIAQRWTTAAKRRIQSSRVEGTRQLVTAIGNLRYKPTVLVSASAIGYYGDRGDETLVERSPWGVGFLPEICREWEREALRAREFGLRVVTPRFGIVLGREGGALPKMLAPFRLGLGGRLGDGRQWMSWIHIGDLLRLLLFAVENQAANGALNASSPKPVTNAEFTRTLAAELRRPAILPTPKVALKLAFGEMANLFFDSLRVLPQATEQAGFRFEQPKLAGALRNLLS